MNRRTQTAFFVVWLIALRGITGSIWIALILMLPVELWLFPWLFSRNNH